MERLHIQRRGFEPTLARTENDLSSVGAPTFHKMEKGDDESWSFSMLFPLFPMEEAFKACFVTTEYDSKRNFIGPCVFATIK